jgi:hypothetical protein
VARCCTPALTSRSVFPEYRAGHFARQEILSAVSLHATAVKMTVEDAQRERARTRRGQGDARYESTMHFERCRSGSLGQKQQASSSAHKLILQVQPGAKHTALQWQYGVAFSLCLSRIPKRVRRVVWRCKLGRHHQNLVWKSRVSFWAFLLQTQVSSRLSPSYDYRAHSPVPVNSSATLPPPPAPTHPACSLTPPPTRHDLSATAPISLPRSTKHKTLGLDIASYLPRLPRYHNGTCFLRFSSCRQ